MLRGCRRDAFCCQPCAMSQPAGHILSTVRRQWSSGWCGAHRREIERRVAESMGSAVQSMSVWYTVETCGQYHDGFFSETKGA